VSRHDISVISYIFTLLVETLLTGINFVEVCYLPVTVGWVSVQGPN